MALLINKNSESTSAYYNLGPLNDGLSKVQPKLASDLKIQKLADENPVLNVDSSLKGKLKMTDGSLGNISTAKDLLSTAENSLLGVNDILKKIEGKVTESTTRNADTNTIKTDIASLANEIDLKLKGTKFNNASLLHSTAGQDLVIKAGESVDTLKLDFASTIASTGNDGYTKNFSEGLSSLANVSNSNLTGTLESVEKLTSSIESLRSAVGSALGKVSTHSVRLDLFDESALSSISNEKIGDSKINDADMAYEKLNFIQDSIHQQTGLAMLAQVNTAPQQIYQLFGGS